jgi:hypothetical protein
MRPTGWAKPVLLRANGFQHFVLRNKRFTATGTAVTVVVSWRVFMTMTAVPVKSTTVSEHSHRNSDVTQHQQYGAADENGEKDRTSLHAAPFSLWFRVKLARICELG